MSVETTGESSNTYQWILRTNRPMQMLFRKRKPMCNVSSVAERMLQALMLTARRSSEPASVVRPVTSSANATYLIAPFRSAAKF